jgi:type I restriction enzyme S subunit
VNWPRYVALHEVASVDSGPAFKSAYFGEPGEGIPLLRGDNIEPGAVRWTRTKTWPVELLEGYEHLALQADDLVLGMDRPVISSGLKLAQVKKKDLPALLVQRVARIRTQGIDSRYLYHWLGSGDFVRHLQRTATGTQLPHVSLASIREFVVPRFDPDTERRIVEILEGHLSRLNAAAVELSRSRAKLAHLRERTMMDALTGVGLADTWDSEPPDPAGTSDGPLPLLPRGWSWSRLGDVADVVGGVTKDASKQSDPRYVDVPYLRVANVQRGRLALDDVANIRVPPAKADALRLVPGDVLLNEGGDRDKLARGWVWEGQIAHCIHQNHVFRARIREPRLDPYFLSFTANTIGGRWAERNGKQSVNLASISLGVIRKMPVIVPAAGEAERIVALIREMQSGFDRISAGMAEAHTRSAMLRKALLTAAFSGRLTGNRQRLDTEALVSL